jgi:hypothetical protein
LLAYFGHHKCGSTWICRIVADVCKIAGLSVVYHHYEELFNGDIESLHAAQPFDFWCYVNADVNFTRNVQLRGFHVIRDPRDVVVSGYFSHLNSHPDAGWARLRHYRRHLKTLSKRDGLMAEIEFSGVFIHHMLSWDYGRDNILELKFEDLIANEAAQFGRILTFLGLLPGKIDIPELSLVLERHSFARLSGGRQRGEEDVHNHYRRGVPGDWRNHFETCHIDYFRKLYNPLLIKLGFESSEDWT